MWWPTVRRFGVPRRLVAPDRREARRAVGDAGQPRTGNRRGPSPSTGFTRDRNHHPDGMSTGIANRIIEKCGYDRRTVGEICRPCMCKPSDQTLPLTAKFSPERSPNARHPQPRPTPHDAWLRFPLHSRLPTGWPAQIPGDSHHVIATGHHSGFRRQAGPCRHCRGHPPAHPGILIRMAAWRIAT